jgi:hypothetical protein
MEGILAWAILNTPLLAIALPVLGGAFAVLHLWRTRSDADRSRRWAVGLALGLGAAVVPIAIVLIGLGSMWAPSPPGGDEIAAWAAGIGALTACAALAGYAGMDRRRAAGAGFGIVLGPVVLILGPLFLAQLLREVGQGVINTAYVDASRARAGFILVQVDEITPTVRDGNVEEIQLTVSITTERTLTLYRSADMEVEWGLLHFALVPPNRPALGSLYAESPVGEPVALVANEIVRYDLEFEAAQLDVQRPPGAWELVMQTSGADGIAYEVSVPVTVAEGD